VSGPIRWNAGLCLRRDSRPTRDVAMVLVDQDLRAQGSAASCSREDVGAAFDYLSNVLIGRVWRDPENHDGDGSIVVLNDGTPVVPECRLVDDRQS
jgi:hypothetical protein